MKIPSLRPVRSARVLAVGAIAAGGLVAAVLPSNAAVSSQSVPVAAIRVESPGTLLARGAAVAVTVTVVCEPGASGGVNLEITENVGGRIAKGFSNATITNCTGSFQQVVINTAADAPTPFRAGVAFGQANLFVSTGHGSTQAKDEREFTIAKPSALV